VGFKENLRSVPGKLDEAGLTSGERVFLYVHAVLVIVLPTLAIALTIFGHGTVRAVGLGLLLLTVVLYAVPTSPILRARVRRRQERASRGS
jgi:hypothetical protein